MVAAWAAIDPWRSHSAASAKADFSHRARNLKMIAYQPKPSVSPGIKETEENRFERIRKEIADRHRKADTDGTRRRDRQTAEDNRLI